MILMLVIFALSFIAFFIHLFVSKEPKSTSRMVELLLLYQLVFNLGVMSFLAFIGFMFFPEKVAASIGWPTCPFEHEMANVNLGYSVLGFMAIWFRGHFWTATIIGASIWLIGDAIGHYLNSIQTHNYSPGNVGITMWTDAIIPMIWLVLLFFHLQYQRASEETVR